MPGSGKTTVGRLVAELMHRPFFDSDAEIERRQGKTCAEIIRERGEPEFRAIEHIVVTGLTKKRGAVIAVGGGAPVYSGELLRRNSVVVYIRRDLEKIAEDLDDTKRPLSRSLEDLRRLYELRNPVYEKLSDEILTNENPADLARTIAVFVANHLRARLLVLNGPNLNMLGIREPGVYGSETYADLLFAVTGAGGARGVIVKMRQSNHEGELIDWIHDALGRYDGIIINPGAYTHYSYAIFDALKSVAAIPAVEVHISDITQREEFRRISVTAPACIAQVYGEGFPGYAHALDILLEAIEHAE
jgi:3-dehydroquinate dehydratase-2